MRVLLKVMVVATATLGVTAPSAGAVSLRSPAHDATVETTNPVLRWAPTSNERTVSVDVFDRSGRVAWRADSLTTDEFEDFGWRRAIRTDPLDAGRYFWRVTVENVETGEDEVYSEFRSFRVPVFPVRSLRVRVVKDASRARLDVTRVPAGRLVVAVRRNRRYVLQRDVHNVARGTFPIETSCFRPGRYRYRVTAYGGASTRKTRRGSFRVVPCALGVRVARHRWYTSLRISRPAEGRLAITVRKKGRYVLRRYRRTDVRRTALSFRTSCFRPGLYRFRVTTYGQERGRKTHRGMFRVRPCLMFFPSRCFNPRRRPQRIIVACGDGNFQLKRLRWRRWDASTAYARGVAWVNDCTPYCAAGRFHTIPALVSLSRRRWCSSVSRFMYTRVRYRMLSSPPGGGRRSGRVTYGCGWYDLY